MTTGVIPLDSNPHRREILLYQEIFLPSDSSFNLKNMLLYQKRPILNNSTGTCWKIILSCTIRFLFDGSSLEDVVPFQSCPGVNFLFIES
jgi:hypothetical protein